MAIQDSPECSNQPCHDEGSHYSGTVLAYGRTYLHGPPVGFGRDGLRGFIITPLSHYGSLESPKRAGRPERIVEDALVETDVPSWVAG